MGKKVKCIDNKGFAVGHLIVGETYEVDERSPCNSADYALIGFAGMTFMKTRFIDVVDDLHTKPTPKVFPAVEVPEWKTWSNIGRDPKNCDCGINKIDCEYHKV